MDDGGSNPKVSKKLSKAHKENRHPEQTKIGRQQ